LGFGLNQRLKERSNYLGKTARVHCRVVHAEVIGHLILTILVHVQGRFNLAIAMGFPRVRFEEKREENRCQGPF
jgi:hypothetical protein